jgi:phenylpyruvate tautomerase PptA (4-oxalocrotonate tautomerase family)
LTGLSSVAIGILTKLPDSANASGEAKAKLAGELTRFHSEYAGVPKNWVHVVFQDYEAALECERPSPF